MELHFIKVGILKKKQTDIPEIILYKRDDTLQEVNTFIYIYIHNIFFSAF